MKGSADIMMTIHYLNIVKQHQESFAADMGNTPLGKAMAVYLKKVNWILNDFMNNPVYTDKVREALKTEMNADSYSVVALTEKIGFLNHELRDSIENVIDRVLAGEELQISE